MSEIERAENFITGLKLQFADKDYAVKHFDIALKALREAAERENPKPLSLDQLRERIGKPVWVDTMKEWRIVITAHDGINLNLYSAYNTISVKHVLNNDGRIYDHEPKGSKS